VDYLILTNSTIGTDFLFDISPCFR